MSSFLNWFKSKEQVDDGRYHFPETHILILGLKPGLTLNISLFSPYYDKVNFTKMVGFFNHLKTLSRDEPSQYAKSPWAKYTINFLGMDWTACKKFMTDHPIISTIPTYEFRPGTQPGDDLLKGYSTEDGVKLRLAFKEAWTNKMSYSTFSRNFPINAYAGLQVQLTGQEDLEGRGISMELLMVYGDNIVDYIQLIESGRLSLDYKPRI